MTIINKHGNKIDYDTAVSYMDDDIREELHIKLAPCTEQEFFDTYCKCHEEKWGDEFIANCLNPRW